MIFPQVYQYQRHYLLEPLAADAFVVVSRKWSAAPHHTGHNTTMPNTPDSVHWDNISRVLDHWGAISYVVTTDDTALTRWVWESTDATLIRNDADAYQSARNTRYHREYMHALSPVAFMQALRWRSCLALINMAEQAAAGERQSIAPSKYSFVLRMRPDFFVDCLMQLPAVSQRVGDGEPSSSNSSVQHGLGANMNSGLSEGSAWWAAYGWDYMALMPRAVADVVLREIPLAADDRVMNCDFNYSQSIWLGAMQLCNPCVARGHGIHIIALTTGSFGVNTLQVARSCNTIYQAQRGKWPCHHFRGPPLASLAGRASQTRSCPNVLQLDNHAANPDVRQNQLWYRKLERCPVLSSS